MTWRSESVPGPVVAGTGDIPAINRLFSEAFTQRYREDGIVGVKVPWLNTNIWEYAIAHAGDGAMLWRDSSNRLAAFNLVHCSGNQGWMGPLAVRNGLQGRGLGHIIVQAGVDYLRRRGATTIGLETMPRTIENIGFYSRQGFLPHHLSITMQYRPMVLSGRPAVRLDDLPGEAAADLLVRVAELTGRVAPGVDFSREIALTRRLRMGDLSWLMDEQGHLRAWVLWQTAPLGLGHPTEELRVLKLVAVDLDSAMTQLDALKGHLAANRMAAIAIRCQTAQAALYSRLIGAGYQVHWTDLRVTLKGYDEPEYRGVFISNWEI